MAVAMTASEWQTAKWKGRHLLDFGGYTGSEIETLLQFAAKLKAARQAGQSTPLLAGKTLGMIFEKASTRTRVSFEVGMFELGGHALFLGSSATQLGRGEPLSDTARVLSRYVSAIMMRTYGHAIVTELANWSTVPVINGLTDLHHPCQALADLLTIQEQFGQLRGVTLAYIGDGNNIAHSLLQACALTGINLRVASPDGYEPDTAVVARARQWANLSGAEISIVQDPRQAVRTADVVYTDVWASMGQEEETALRQAAFAPYQVNQELLSAAGSGVWFMHDLPAHRGEEVTADVIDGKQSLVFDQAENRLHAQKALLAALIAGVVTL